MEERRQVIIGVYNHPFSLWNPEDAQPVLRFPACNYTSYGTTSLSLTSINTTVQTEYLNYRYRHVPCWRFTGGNLLYNASNSFRYTNNFSYSYWAQFNGTGWGYVFTFGRADAGNYAYGSQINGGSNTIGVWAGNRCITCSLPSVTDKLHFVAAVAKDRYLYCYIDGKLAGGPLYINSLATYGDSGTGFGYGCFHYSSNIYYFNGWVTDARVYSKPLAEGDIRHLYRCGPYTQAF